MEELTTRLIKALSAVLVAITIGTLGFKLFATNDPSLFDCFYMTVITLSTVGYGEVVELNEAGHLFASLLILFGMGTLLYFGSTVIAMWVEIDLNQIRRRKKMQNQIDALKGHVIVCGCGTTGSRVVEELMDTQTPFVVLDTDTESLEEMAKSEKGRNRPLLYIHGDATDDKILAQAGLERASGLVAALRNDKDNVYLIFSSKQFNPSIRIIARATEKDVEIKMLRAGAAKVVSPNILGGMRIASEMLRPAATEFLDVMLRDKGQNQRIDEIKLPASSPLVGKTLSSSHIRKVTDVLVLAIRVSKADFIYNPGSDTELKAGQTLVVLGAMESINRLRKSLHSSTITSISTED